MSDELPCSSLNELSQPGHDPLSLQDDTSVSYLQMPGDILAKDQQSMQSCRVNDITSTLVYPWDQCGEKNMTYLRQAVEILGSVYSLHPSQVCVDDQLNQDILIRAILEGWHILKSKTSDPLWDIVRKMDTSINIQSGHATRLAMLRGIHQFLLVRTPTPRGN